MLSKRIIACLDVRDGQVVKGINFEGLRSAGDPAELARRYNAEGIDELVILDVTATIEGRRALADTIRVVSAELFIPLAVGGGIRSEADAAAAIDGGADKVSLNTAALAEPDLVTRLAARYGSQAIVVAIDAKRNGDRFDVYARRGRAPAHLDRSRRHAQRLRLRAHGRRVVGGDYSGDCVRRRRNVRSLRRCFHARAGGCRAGRVGLPFLG